MASGVLGSVALPRFSSTRSAMTPVYSATSLRRTRPGSLPDVKGLKFSGRSGRVSSVASGGSVRFARRGVVCEAQDTATGVPDVTKDTWQSLVLECDLPVLVEFWAPWCGPCRMIHPVIGELSKEYAGKMKCLKLNTDESPDIATQYGIRSIPTIMIFKNGEKKDAVIGAVPKTTLVSSIDKFL